MKKTLIILVAGFSVMFSQGMKGRILEKLELDEAQKTKVEEIFFKHQQNAIDLKAKIQKNQLELKKHLSEKNIDEKLVRSLTAETNKIRTEMQESRLNMWFDVNKQLNDKQKEIWKNTFQHNRKMGRFSDEGMQGKMMKNKMRGFKKMHNRMNF